MPHPDNRISPFSAPRGGPPSRSPFRRSPRRRTGLIRRRGPSEQRGAARAPARTAASRRAVRPIGKGRNSTADSSHGTWTAVTARNKRFNSTVDNSHSTKQAFQRSTSPASFLLRIFSLQHAFSSALFGILSRLRRRGGPREGGLRVSEQMSRRPPRRGGLSAGSPSGGSPRDRTVTTP